MQAPPDVQRVYQGASMLLGDRSLAMIIDVMVLLEAAPLAAIPDLP